MKVLYNIEQVLPKVFSVIIEDPYDRAMVFCRAQEYYESPNPEFRGKDFNIWEYMKWYSKEKGSFSYPKDWSGFNIPFNTLFKLYNRVPMHFPSPYDIIMNEIVDDIYGMNEYTTKGYVIGSGDRLGSTFEHELCHGLFSTNRKYKKLALENVGLIKKKHYNVYKKNLLDMGYTDKVIDDEIQAYMMFGWNNPKFSKGVPLEITEMYHTWFDADLNNDFLN